MVKRLEDSDRDFLSFRPNISFVQPPIEDGVIDPVGDPTGDNTQIEDVRAGRTRIKNLANAVNVMAAAIQSRADQRVGDMEIALDPSADTDAIQAMRRKFPGADPNKITYEQYRQVKADIRNKGIAVGNQPLVTSDEVRLARSERDTFIPGGFDSVEAQNGGLRPELDSRAQIIPPINVEQVQISLICILVNFVWKEFIKPTVASAAFPVGGAIYLLPDQLCDPGADIDIPGLLILGQAPDDLLSGRVAAEAAQEAGI